MDKMREEFEEFVRMNVYAGSLTKNADGDYFDHVVGPMWIGWKASREVLVIELPDVSKLYEHSPLRTAVEDCRYAIESSGVTVKQ